MPRIPLHMAPSLGSPTPPDKNCFNYNSRFAQDETVVVSSQGHCEVLRHLWSSLTLSLLMGRCAGEKV